MHTSKRDIRKQIRKRRQQISKAERQLAKRQLANQFQQHRLLLSAKHIALYLENDGEISTQACIRACWQRGIAVYLPILDPIRKGHLLFGRYTPATALKKNRYGILEPSIRSAKRSPLWLDGALLPLVAFTQEGTRLGMGGGYYDRTFARKRPSTHLIGVAFECQKMKSLPKEPWDVPLSAIITEQRSYNVKSTNTVF